MDLLSRDASIVCCWYERFLISSQVYACREEKGVLTGVRGARLHAVHTQNSQDGRTTITYKVALSFQLVTQFLLATTHVCRMLLFRWVSFTLVGSTS